jgi:hypothetical protein
MDLRYPHEALVYFFLIGALCPIVAWLISLKWPNGFIRYVKCVFSALPRNFSHEATRVQLSRYLQRYGGHSPSQCAELRPLGNCWIRFPICYSAKAFLLVDEVQL